MGLWLSAIQAHPAGVCHHHQVLFVSRLRGTGLEWEVCFQKQRSAVLICVVSCCFRLFCSPFSFTNHIPEGAEPTYTLLICKKTQL
ncbi:hypothetical protein BS78_09G093300 [Paspalum vaginatum]|nr:hypothetical protein BS78_09G093300 [Paspalum vaginatum]